MSDTRLVRAVVEDTDGRPIANARVSIADGPAPTPDIAALTDHQGRVTLSLPCAGEYRLVCAADSYGTEHHVVVATEPSNAVTIRLSAN